MRLARGASSMLHLKRCLCSTMSFPFCIWQNCLVNTRETKIKIFACPYIWNLSLLKLGVLQSIAWTALVKRAQWSNLTALWSVVWTDTTTLSKNQSKAQMSLLCKSSSPAFSGNSNTEQGVWMELVSRLRKSKTHAGGCVAETWSSSRGKAVEFLQKWQIGQRKRSLSQQKELLKEDTTGERMEDKSNLGSGFCISHCKGWSCGSRAKEDFNDRGTRQRTCFTSRLLVHLWNTGTERQSRRNF